MGTGCLPSQSRNVGISAYCVVVSAELVRHLPAVGTLSRAGLICYSICGDHSALELDVHGLFSITGEVLYVWGICCCCAWPCPRMSAREGAAGTVRLILYFDWEVSTVVPPQPCLLWN